jgi:peptidase S41-like protein
VIRRLIPRPFRYVGFELRSTEEWVRGFDSYVQFLTATRGPQYYVDFYRALLNDVNTAFQEGGHTGQMPIDFVAMNPLPLAPGLDQVPLLDKDGSPVGYAKPMMVLTDEFSFSGADYFAATMQDNKAATLFGFRTGGLGGTNASYNAGAYSEAVIGMLRGFMVRSTTVSAVGYPATNYVENVGVQPDIVEDYKTKDNLLNGGATFVADFTNAMVTLIQQANK